MKSLNINIITFLLFLLYSLPLMAQYAPEEMPNVNVSNRYEYVSDPGNLMSPEVKAQVNEILSKLRESTTAEVAVALPPDIGDTPIEDWSEQLFTSWGIGKSDKDNGVLLVIAPEQCMARIQTGYGSEGVLTDIACKKIITHHIAPHMREGDIDSAVLDAVTTISAAMSDPAVADELRSSQKDAFQDGVNSIDKSIFLNFIYFIIGGCFLTSFILLIYKIFKYKGADKYHKAIDWRNSLPAFLWLSIGSVGLGLIIYLTAFLLYRYNRNSRRSCSTCGHKMNRLPEDKDNELLSSSEDFEEKLNTIDYDVWECPDCGTIERYPFKTKQLKYTECPQCGTVAMHLVSENTIRPATTRSEGLKQKIYECEYCHHKKVVPVVIPKEEPPVVILPIGGGGSGGGFGGGIGGGFGGGSTGGGGASGGW